MSATSNGPSVTCVGDSIATFPGAAYNNHAAGAIVSTSLSIPNFRELAVAGIPAGTYDIDSVAYDGAPGRDTSEVQPNEQFVLEFLDEFDVVVATTPLATDDLADSVEETTWSGPLGEVVFDRTVFTVRATHAFIGNTPTANSVMPVCVGWSAEAPPTTTTTEAPATTTTTEAPATTTTMSAPTTTTVVPATTTVPTQVLPEIEESPDPTPTTATPTFTG